MSNFKSEKAEFEAAIDQHTYESTILTFHGVGDCDVYNPSVPFIWNGREYIYGRVEKRESFATSWTVLFEKTGKDEFTRVKDCMIYQLEDPFIAQIGETFTLGGTFVEKVRGTYVDYKGHFYRGADPSVLVYFTTGPDFMKDVRIVDMKDGKGTIGVFSRPRGSQELYDKYGSTAMVGFTTISNLDDLTPEVVSGTDYLVDWFGKDEWGGCNQAMMLENGRIGMIAHHGFQQSQGDVVLSVYATEALELDPVTLKIFNRKIIATRKSFPDYDCKLDYLTDCTFPSGIVVREDGKADLYSGIGDVAVGRAVIDYPFSAPVKK